MTDVSEQSVAAKYRLACADAAQPVINALGLNERVAIEGYANSEFWAGWNAALAHAAQIARTRHRCWGNSEANEVCDDISACENIATAIEYQILHGKAPVSRIMPAALLAAPRAGEVL